MANGGTVALKRAMIDQRVTIRQPRGRNARAEQEPAPSMKPKAKAKRTARNRPERRKAYRFKD